MLAIPGAPSIQLGAGVLDGATRADAEQASGVVTVSGNAGNRINVSFNSETNGAVDATKTVLKEVVGRGVGVRVPVTLTAADVTKLGDGPVYVNGVQVNRAGKAGASASASFVIDTIQPATPVVELGAGIADGATRAEALQTSGVVAVAGDVGNRISVSFIGTPDGGLYGKTIFFKKVVTGKGAGVPVPVTLTSSEVARLGNGPVSVNCVQVDRAGNSSGIGSARFTIDTSPPAAPVVRLGTGVQDGATRRESKQASGVVTVSGKAGNRINVSFNSATNGAVDATKTVLKEVVGRGAGVRVPVTLTGADVTKLGDGPVYVNGVQVDRAGNVGPLTSVFYRVDTTPPATPDIRPGIGMSDGVNAIEATQASGIVAVSGEADNRVSVSFIGTTNGTIDYRKVVSKEVLLEDTNRWMPVKLTPEDVRNLGEGLVYVYTAQVDPAGRMSSLRTTSFRLSAQSAEAADLIVSLADGVLRIDGTDGDDAVIVRESDTGFTVDYSSSKSTVGNMTFPKSVSKLEVLAGAGQDMIMLQAPSLASRTVVDTGEGADVVVSPEPVDVRAESGADLPVPAADRSLLVASAITTRRIELPNRVRETTYVGQSFVTSRTWTADGRQVEVGLDGQGNTSRDTYLGDRLALAESWDATGGYQRTVTSADGTRVRKTFGNGTLQIVESERDGVASATVWGVNGSVVRHATDGRGVVLEEAWNGEGGYRRTRVDDSGKVTKEVFDQGTLEMRTVVDGRRAERIGQDVQGNNVFEELVDDVVVRRDQSDNSGGSVISRFADGRLASRETLQSGRRVQLETWTEGQFVRTAWNDNGDRIVQTFSGDVKVSEEEIRTSGERRLTEWVGAETIRTTTDAVGNVSVERSKGEQLISREIKSVAGDRLLTTFDSVTGKADTEERSTADGHLVQRTTWSAEETLRLTSRDGVTVARESWRDEGLQRTSDDGAGTIRVEQFTGSDRETLAEGVKVAETVTAPGGVRQETTWDPDGTRRLKGTVNAILVLEETEQGGTLKRIVYGSDGSRQEEVLSNGERTLKQSAGGSYREQRFSASGNLTYELITDGGGSTQQTEWEMGGQRIITRIADYVGAKRNNIKTIIEPWIEQRTLWRGDAENEVILNTYLEQTDAKLRRSGEKLQPSDLRQLIEFVDKGEVVFIQKTYVNGTTRVERNLPSAAWNEVQQGSYFGLSGGNDFDLAPGGGGFNLVGIGGYVGERIAVAEKEGEKYSGGVTNALKPLEQITAGFSKTFSGIQSVTRAIVVNVNAIQGDLSKFLGSIDFGKLSLPKLEDLQFDRINFSGIANVKWQPLDIKLADPFASNDFSAVRSPAMWSFLGKSIISAGQGNLGDAYDWFTGRIDSTGDWLADRDPFAWAGEQLGVKWGSVERKVLLIMPGERYLEAGYTRDQATLLYDLMDRTPRGLRGHYLDEFNAFLAEEGLRVYQAHLEAGGGELDAAGHDRVRQAAAETAQSRLLARYGLNSDGTRIPSKASNPGFGLQSSNGGDSYKEYRNDSGAIYNVEFGDGQITAPNPSSTEAPKRPSTKTETTNEQQEDRDREIQEKKERELRVEQINRDVHERFAAAIGKTVSEKLDLYAQGKGKQVAEFHDSLEQTMRIGGAFAAGLGDGAVAAVEGLAKSVVAVLDADTWKGVATAVKQQGRNFMRSEDKAKFITDLGERTYKSLEDALVKSIDEWERASPEARARLLGRLAGQIATEAVLYGALGKIAGKAIDSTKLGRKTGEAVERVTTSKEFPAYEKRVKDAAVSGKTDLNTLLEGHNKSTRESFAKQLRSQAGMDPEHARKIAEFAKERKQVIVVRSSNPVSLQYHGKPGFAAKSGDLKLKTNPQTGLVTASRRTDGALIDARGELVKGYTVDAQNRILNTEKLTSGKPTLTKYRLEKGHVVDSKGTKFFSDYDINSIDAEPLNGPGWEMIATGDKTTGPGPIIGDLNEAIVGRDRSRDMFKHGANRENYKKYSTGIYQIETPDVGDTFTVFDSDGTIFVADQLYVRRLFEGRNIPTADVLPSNPLDNWLD